MASHPQQGRFPADAPEVTIPKNPLSLIALLEGCGVGASNGERKRLIEGGGVSINGIKIADPKAIVTVSDGDEFKAGRKNFARLRLGTSPSTPLS